MQLVPPLMDLRRLCECGHSWTWHCTDNGTCTHEILDTTNDGWMRCACDRWRG